MAVRTPINGLMTVLQYGYTVCLDPAHLEGAEPKAPSDSRSPQHYCSVWKESWNPEKLRLDALQECHGFMND